MRRYRLLVAIATVVLVAPLLPSSAAAPSDPRRASVADTLNAFRVKATAENLRALALAGYDVTEGRDLERGTVDVVGYADDLARFNGRQLSSYRAAPASAARAQAAPTDGASDAEWTVWTKYDAVQDDDKEQYTETYDRIVADYPSIAKKRVTGTTYGGREIVALQITKGATGSDIPRRPAVLYNAMQHAREWLAGETCRRTLDYFTRNYGKGTSAGLEVTRLVNTTELWFVCVNNPDGYEFTFTPGNRLWRKNLRDNNDDGVIGAGDGVDPNRNFSGHWGFDEEGSSPDPASETYRGPSAASEPETMAMEALFEEIHPVFQKNDHTAAELLLYPQGFQQDTPTADHEIFTALAGDPFKPAIPGFLPELSAGLYITNGDFTDWAYNSQKTLSFTPEGTSAEDPGVTGFEYPDSPLQVAQEFQRHLPFALDLAHSSLHPATPTSHLGNKAEPFVVDSFEDSYGDPQPVGAVVKRSLGKVKMHYKIKGKKAKTKDVKAYHGGDRYYDDPGVYYRRVRGVVKGTKPGDRVKVWFSAGKKESDAFRYRARVESNKRVLVLANEDWSGVQPNPAPLGGPQYLNYYTAALKAAGVKYEVYDVDASDRRPPHPLGVLDHFSHVVWYTGDDYVPREPDAPGGSGITKGAVETQNNVRDFLNDGGKLFYSGKNAGRVFAEGYQYNPFQAEEGTYCQNQNPTCIVVQNDFLQYWLGAYTYITGAGQHPEDGSVFEVDGTEAPFDALDLTVNGADSAGNADQAPTLLVTSSILDPTEYPLFADSRSVAAWERPFAAPFDPVEGDWFVSAGAADAAYKRLAKTFDLTGETGATLDLSASFDLEPDYDYLFVEIHTVGQDDWTTLADSNGHTSDDVGLSCPTTGDGSNWQVLHPFLAHYQTITDGGDSCDPTGTSGAWNAATGNSGGWQDWEMPIPAEYIGKQVEVSISVVSDPAVQGLGAWVDQVSMRGAGDAPIDSADPSFETGLDDWATPGPPPGTADPVTGWERAQSAPFVETPIVTTDETVYTGLGLEAVSGAANRAALMRASLEHLGLLP